MSHLYLPVRWVRFKLLYGAILIAAIVLYLAGYQTIGARSAAVTLQVDAPTLAMKPFGR